MADRAALSVAASYGAYSKHKSNPTAYRLHPYAGMDEDRTYCDAHAGFGPNDVPRIRKLLVRGILLGLWSEDAAGSSPSQIWTIDDNGWIYEMAITNSAQAQYHGYPVLTGDAFAKQVLARARDVAFDPAGFTIPLDPVVKAAIVAAEVLYR